MRIVGPLRLPGKGKSSSADELFNAVGRVQAKISCNLVGMEQARGLMQCGVQGLIQCSGQGAHGSRWLHLAAFLALLGGCTW
eukprot:scaffold136893_cov17-Tisochrysis_lutea.AAC.2